MTEKILKLLKSPVYEDVIIGLNLIKDYTWEELCELPCGDDYRDIEYKVRIDVNIKGDANKDNFILNSAFCHYNSSLHIYKGKPGDTYDATYIKL